MIEKEKYYLLLNNLPDAFAYHQMVTNSLETPVDYIFMEVNKAFVTMTGLQKNEVLGKKITAVHPEIVHSSFNWIETYGRVAAGHGTARFERYFEPLKRWYEITAYSDVPGYFATVFRDISENKHFQKTLKESEENLFVTLHSIGDGVIATDLNRKITRMNPQAEKLTGWTFLEAANRPLDEIFRIVNIKTGEPAFNPVQHVLKTGEILKLANDTALIGRDGNYYHIADSAAPIRDREGKIAGAILVFSDVTEQYQARKSLEETKQRLEHILKATRTGMDIIDKDFNLKYVDDLWQGIYGAYAGRKCYEYFKDRKEPCNSCGAPRALATKQTTFSEQILPKENNRVVECHTVPFQNEKGAWRVAEFKIDITRLKQLEEILKFQLQFEKIVSSISNSFVDMKAGKIDEIIARALQQIGTFFDADRSVIFQLSFSGETLTSTHEWCAAGTRPLLSPLQSFSRNELPWLFRQVRKKIPFYISDPSDIPAEAKNEIKGFKIQDIQSILILPFSIKKDGYAHGFLAIDSAQKNKSWAEEEVNLLNIATKVIAGALSRQQLEKERNKALGMLKKSEENLAVTLHSIGDGVITTDLHGKITRLNPKAEDLTGWSQNEALGQPLWNVFHIVHVKTGKPAFNPVYHVLKTGETVGLANDTALIARDGNRYQISDSAAPIRDNEGKITGAVMVFSNVTVQYEAREALKKSEARYRMIVENINDALIICDFQGKIVDLNQATCKLLGYEQNELLGANIAIIWKLEEKRNMPHRLKQLLKVDKLLFEGIFIHKKSFPIPVEVSQKIVSHEGNGLIQSFVRDITGRKQTEQQIASYTSKLENLYQKLDAEMDRAREIHMRTLPKDLPVVKGLSFAAHYQPAEKLGGDFYDVLQLGKKLVIYLSDVTGHGADGAMLSVFVKHTIKGYLFFSPEKNVRPGKILRYLSTQFQQKNLPPEYFICIFLAVLDLETMELTYTAAGFQDAPLVRLGDGKRLRLTSKGLFLSLAFSDKLLNLQEGSIRLTPGTTIFFNTDGLTEQGAKNARYGAQLPVVFYKYSHLSPSLLTHFVCEDFRKFNGNSLQGNDDITFLILQVNPSPQKTERFELASNFAELKKLREKIAAILGEHEKAGLFLTCLHELTSNAMEHGNRLDQEKKVSVEIIITNQYVQGSVKDQGAGFNWREQIEKPLELDGITERGRGIAMARLCCEQLFYNEKGNRAFFLMR